MENRLRITRKIPHYCIAQCKTLPNHKPKIMSSKLIRYHAATEDLALFLTDEGVYWIGEYDPFLTHQTDEPNYVWVDSAESLDDGIEKLMQR